MNSKIKKIIGVLLAMVLASVVSVASTLALLNVQSNSSTNTFVPTPTLMDDNSKFKVTESVGKDFAIVPLAVYTKDPVVTTGEFLTDGVVYLEVVVENNTKTVAGVPNTQVVRFEIDSCWEDTGYTTAKGGKLYVYKPTAEQKADATDYAVKEGITLAGVGILKDDKVSIVDYTDNEVTVSPTISFYGYALQSLYKAGTVVNDLTSALEAWQVNWN